MNEIFTIGYASYTPDTFLTVLKKYRITALADVRARPYSTFKPEFSEKPLGNFLKANKIAYVFLGDQCGVSIRNLSGVSPGRTFFQVMAETENFKSGLERIKNGMKKYRLVLMCAEKDPLTCHRFLLVCRHLPAGTRIRHILEDGRIEEQQKTEERLLRMYDLDQPDLFRSSEERLNLAYSLQEEKLVISRAA